MDEQKVGAEMVHIKGGRPKDTIVKLCTPPLMHATAYIVEVLPQDGMGKGQTVSRSRSSFGKDPWESRNFMDAFRD